MKKTLLNGLVLAGGLSSRMRTDKGLLVYHGVPQREFLFDLLKQFCDEVYTSCREGQSIPNTFHPLVDRLDIPGPMNGIMSAFAQAPQASWLIMAVDMPYVDAATLKLLLEKRDRAKVATCFYNPERAEPEPLLTVWEDHAYPLLRRYVDAEKFSPKEFLKTHPVQMIQPPNEQTLLNFNTPDDLHEKK